MTVDNNTFMVKKVQKMEHMYVAFCAFTGMPFLICDEESYNDQVWIFETEELLQSFAKPYTERKVLLRGVEFKNKDFLRFFSSLFTMGVNELVFVETGTRFSIPLESLVHRPDYSKMKPEQRPVTNPNLQLTGIYFMQEAARPVPNEEKENLKDLEEELASNMVKARYIIPLELGEGPGTLQEKLKANNYKLPVLKDKDGNVFQPIFTDPIELEKFSKGKRLSAIAVPFGQLSRLISKEAKGYMLNPGGYHILMPRTLLEALPKRFQ